MTRSRDDVPPESALVVGYVVGGHGVHGGLRVHLHDPASEALVPGRTLFLRTQAAALGAYSVVTVERVPGKPARRRVMLEGIDDRDRAEALRGAELLVDRADLPPLAADEFYLADVIGLLVERERDGRPQALGTVVGVTSNGVQDLFEVQWRDPKGRAHTWLLPVLPEFLVEVGERVRVDLPLGMLPDALEGEG